MHLGVEGVQVDVRNDSDALSHRHCHVHNIPVGLTAHMDLSGTATMHT
jgi:hypothetical protein